MEYKSETKTCQNCKKDFVIEPDDFTFYEKIKVPAPTWCPDCRQQRRYAWRNERTLYRRNCDLCGKSTITIYSENKPCKVYCLSCWWSDKWEPTDYGRDFDFSKPFFEQYREMQKKVPRMALLSKNSVDSDYTNHSGGNKNVYLSFTGFFCENVSYSSWVFSSKDSMELSYVYDSEKLYGCIDCRKTYHSQYGILLKDCMDCYYCYDCHNCNNCFLSSNLRNKKFVFKNKQYTKEEYFNEIEKYDLKSYETRVYLEKEFSDLLINDSIHRYVVSEKNVNCTGNMMYNSKNSKNVFDVEKLEDTKSIYASLIIKSAMDLYHVGGQSTQTELVYENHGCIGLYSSSFCHLCYDNSFLTYCDSCQNSQNLFGCISVKKGEYMILNKKYSKEEYLKLKEKIIEHMKKTGEYGEFFPASVAPVCYNETQGNYYMPLSKEEVLSMGFLWEDKVPGIFGKETILPDDLPDSIKDVKDEITSEILKCSECNKNYNIISSELAFYRQENIPIPRSCSDCRYKWRFSMRPPRKLWHRTCMNKDCTNEFETSYSPDRPEIIYCEQCYQKEVY